ncbi:hypothetical protein ACTG9Q_22280 [Actinokineospora sp. 24-640]
MSTPIFDELLREMRATAEEPRPAEQAPPAPPAQPAPGPAAQPGGRRRRPE